MSPLHPLEILSGPVSIFTELGPANVGSAHESMDYDLYLMDKLTTKYRFFGLIADDEKLILEIKASKTGASEPVLAGSTIQPHLMLFRYNKPLGIAT